MERISAHNAGHGAAYTRANRPVTLVAAWGFSSRQEAVQAERSLKVLSPQRKLALAALAPIKGEDCL